VIAEGEVASSAPPSRAYVALGGLVALVLLAICFADPHHAPNFDDGAGVYWVAGAKALRHETVYDVTGHYTFNYLPFAALFYAFAFAVFPVHAFEWAFYFLSVAGWLGVVLALGRALVRDALGAAALSRAWDGAILIAFALFYGVGLRDELKLGQTMIIPLVAATAFMLWYDRARKRPAPRPLAIDLGLAGLLAFAIEMKIYFAVLVALMAFRREWRIVLLVAAWHVVLSVGLVALWHGPSFALSENMTWFSAVRYASDYHMLNSHNMSVMGVVAKTGVPMILARVAWVAASGAFLYALWRVRAISPLRGAALCLAAVVPLNPIAWPYWTLLGFPAMLFVVATLLRLKREGDRTLAWKAFPLLLYFVMSAAQNEGFAKRGGLLVACLALVALAFHLATRDTRAAQH
jgi:hypothetical protein